MRYMHMTCLLYTSFPEGIGVVEWMVPGGREIAVVTSRLMETYNAVIWAHHGMFCSGVDFDSTFGLMHTIEKSAEMWIKVHSCRPVSYTHLGYAQGFIRRIFQLSLICHAVCIPYDIRKLILLCLGYACLLYTSCSLAFCFPNITITCSKPSFL